MNLTKALAERYGRYRLRFLEGPKGAYGGEEAFPPDQPYPYTGLDGVTISVPCQRRGEAVTFLRQLAADPAVYGTYTVATELELDAATGDEKSLETCDIAAMGHGDNVLHASWAFLTFACEYIVTLDLEALGRARDILRSFQRLGNHKPGHRETEDGFGPPSHPGSPPYGYLIRSDVVDDKSSAERLQTWAADPDGERRLEPSPDQYTSLLCTAAIADRLLRAREGAEADPAWGSPEHSTLRDEVLGLIRERVETCHHYVAANCRYLLRRHDGLASDRGPWAWQFAYPLAKVAAGVLDGNQAEFRGRLEPFTMQMLPDILTGFIEGDIGEFARRNAEYLTLGALRDIHKIIFEQVCRVPLDAKLNALTHDILGTTFTLLQFLGKYGFDRLETSIDEIRSRIEEQITTWVQTIVLTPLQEMIRQALQAMIDAGEVLDREASLALSKFLFRVMSGIVFAQPHPPLNKGMLDLGGEGVLTRLLREMKLFDTGAIQRALDFATIRIEIRTRPVEAEIRDPITGTVIGTVTIIPSLGDWGTLEFNPLDPPLIDWDRVLDLVSFPFQVTASTVLYWFFNFLGWTSEQINAALGEDTFDWNPLDAGYMPFGYFLYSAVADLFGEGGFDGAQVARHYDNALFMALLHTLQGYPQEGNPDQLKAFQDVMGSLDRAPATFPNGRDPNDWNQDFRWLRSKEKKDSAVLYSGLDFMCALMLAAARDPGGNRQAVRDGILAAYEFEKSRPGPGVAGVFYLPFRGPIRERRHLYDSRPPELDDEKLLYLGIVFTAPGRSGAVVLELDGVAHTFQQAEAGRLILVPTPREGVWVRSADPGVSGWVVLAPAPAG